MKKELIIGICLLAVIFAVMVYLASDQQRMAAGKENINLGQPSPTHTSESSDIAGRISHNLALNSSLSMVGDVKKIEKIMVYKTLPPEISLVRLDEYAKKFNVSGTLRDGENAMSIQSEDKRYGLEISKPSGSARYQDQNRPNAQSDAPEILPTDEEAIKIATKFLKDQALYPEGATDPVIHREISCSTDNEIYYGQIGVWYPRRLNGLMVENTQLVVYVGGNGDVIGYFANWRRYEPYQEYPVTTPQDAFDKLKKDGIPVGMNNQDSIALIDEEYLAYATTAAAYNEDYLRPVWVFKGNVMVDGKSVMPVEKYVPALTDDSVKSLSSS